MKFIYVKRFTSFVITSLFAAFVFSTANAQECVTAEEIFAAANLVESTNEAAIDAYEAVYMYYTSPLYSFVDLQYGRYSEWCANGDPLPVEIYECRERVEIERVAEHHSNILELEIAAEARHDEWMAADADFVYLQSLTPCPI
ncbi:hypothetical protein PQU92_02515 [Asticcacaulis sp. BYS171W]|uniref:Uncharacterized protein n=1 Tax=Asticcacaulis aquaticus TaxID=2984212 RepID=A0ABT5HQN0_9CAUL|nr:hypothetical protein [Asticcacaulis aquaticus]MDC7682130.1 hypothetical protein [Asticcacaulis aquaticus]